MKLEDGRKPKRMHFSLVLLLSFLGFFLGIVIDQTLRWTNHLAGFLNGLLLGGMCGLAWCVVYVLPWSLIILGIYRWAGLNRFRTEWLLAPSVIIFLAWIGSILIIPNDPAHRFKRFAKTELPANVQNLHFEFTGGGFANYGDTYYFQTTPNEIDRLIAGMQLIRDESHGRQGSAPTQVTALPDCPEFASWEGVERYQHYDDSTGWFYCLITDASKTQTYIFIGGD
jgi:hypothetical protein